MNIPDWHTYFMGLAIFASMRSKDEESHNGCVIADQYKRIVGTGYNSFPRGLTDGDYPTTRPGKYKFMAHAELNALSNCVLDTQLYECTLYTTTEPCENCTMAIIAHGIKRVIYLHERKNEASRVMLENARIPLWNFAIECSESNIPQIAEQFAKELETHVGVSDVDQDTPSNRKLASEILKARDLEEQVCITCKFADCDCIEADTSETDFGCNGWEPEDG